MKTVTIAARVSSGLHARLLAASNALGGDRIGQLIAECVEEALDDVMNRKRIEITRALADYAPSAPTPAVPLPKKTKRPGDPATTGPTS
jgi:hypothetical protein